MLWYKAWAESRVRFLIAGVVMAGACLFILGRQDPSRVLFSGPHRTLFIVFAFLFGMGGLVRESELGTSSFTLTLPVTRRRLTLVRACVGVAEMALLALATVLIVACASPFLRQPYPMAKAVELALRWLAGGFALFGVAFLASTTLSGEYTAVVAAFVVFFAHTVTTQFIRLARPATLPYMFTVQEVMSGMRPSLTVPTTVAVALGAIFVVAASIWTERRDF